MDFQTKPPAFHSQGSIGIPRYVFCGYGFLASLEPSANAMALRIGYATLGSLAAVSAALPLVRTTTHE